MLSRLSRRGFLTASAAMISAAALPLPVLAQPTPVRGGTLRFLVDPEPTGLVPLADTTGANVMVSGKITEGLYAYNPDFSLRPQLALSHTVNAEGTEIVFTLREGVKWHDGQPFTAEDAAFSLNTLKTTHPRGRATFANMTEAVATGPHELTLRLSKPAPYLLNALAGQESPIFPKHLYEGSDPTTNAHNLKPIGTGPFRFVEWERGSHMILERNGDYWDPGKPYLDGIIFRFIPDAASRSIAFETEEVDVGGDYPIPYSDLARLKEMPHLSVETGGYAYGPNIGAIEFNLDNPVLARLEVRQAIAHAIERQKILDNVYYGWGQTATGPIHHAHVAFYTADVPRYDFDLERANALLDEAGYPRNDKGIRFSITHDALPITNVHVQIGEYIRQALAQVGIDVKLRTSDMSSYIKRVYTDRDFDIVSNTMTNSPDPTLGVQRFFWSKNFKPGVPFSNGSHYVNPEVDALLEAAQIETDITRRQGLFHDFQKIAARDIPTLYTVDVMTFTLANRRLHDHTITADGVHASLADAWLEA